MVYRVLSIIAGVLMSLTGLVLVVCLGYTMAVPLFEAGVSGVRASLDNALDAASDTMGVDLGALGEGWQSQAAALVSAVGSGPWGALGGGGDASGFADPAQGELYLQWKSVVGDPVGEILSGTGVSVSVLEGIAGGSGSAANMLSGLDETALSAVESNAIRYGTLAAGAEVAASLPEGVRASMWEANSNAQSFATDVQAMVATVRAARGGDPVALAGLPAQASAAVGDLNAMNACMERAESALRG